TVTGVGRHVQPLRVAVCPPPGARPEWEVLQELIYRMGAPIKPSGLDAVQAEIGRIIPAYAALTAGGLDGEGFQWPAEALTGGPVEVSASGDGGPRAGGGVDGRLRLLTAPQIFTSGAMVGESEAIRRAWPRAFDEVHPDTASSLGLSDGEGAYLSCSRGRIPITVRVDGKTPPGAVFVPSGAGDFPSNALLSADDWTPAVTVERRAE
ncbi:MAG: molybdopterin dinucleotide binding domain-containing protein, partial [Nitrospinota bacterium]